MLDRFVWADACHRPSQVRHAEKSREAQARRGLVEVFPDGPYCPPVGLSCWRPPGLPHSRLECLLRAFGERVTLQRNNDESRIIAILSVVF
jgi:hypothetical protein